ncbi:MAG: RtcB family protein, partial [Methanosarcinales archaeon]
MRDFEKTWIKTRIKYMNFTSGVKNTDILAFMKYSNYKSDASLYKITTRSGKEIVATEDHPFYTPEGMIEVKHLINSVKKEKIAIYPYEGVPYQEPSEEVILEEEDLKKLPLNKDLTQTIRELKKRDLLPLKVNNEKLPYLLKLMGFILGDGTSYFTGNKGTIWFYGEPEDLFEIRQDIKAIGYTPSRIYTRIRNHSNASLTTIYDTFKFTRTEYAFKTNASSLAALIMALGVPFGEKAAQNYEVPEWIFRLPLWQKRLFLASLFGAELSSPRTITGHGYNFYEPVLSMNKKEEFISSGKIFLEQISDMLREFDIESSHISEREEYINKKGDVSYRLRLQISGTPENLIKLWGKIGFEYNQKKRYLANVAVQYLQLKKKVLREREKAALQALQMKKEGQTPSKIYETLKSEYINTRFLERSLYETRKTSPRIASNFPKFEEFLKESTKELSNSGMVWDFIENIEEIPYNADVYDFTVASPYHNFIANNFVVSNCGVRLIRTNLTLEDVKPKIKQLIDNLFIDIPSGVGSKSRLRVSVQELLDDVFIYGAQWAVEKGYGFKEDIEHCEENGRMEVADSSEISDKAIKRGRPQLGTLGSGNHFLEIQYVDKSYDEKIADVFGLQKGPIT